MHGEGHIGKNMCKSTSLIPRPFPQTVFDHFQYANTALHIASNQILAV